MKNFKELCEDLRRKIVNLHKSVEAIVKHLQILGSLVQTTVHKYIQMWHCFAAV